MGLSPVMVAALAGEEPAQHNRFVPLPRAGSLLIDYILAM
jgi:hypothetical protein